VIDALPDLHEGVLQKEELSRLFTDLETLVAIEEIRLKFGAVRHAREGTCTLTEAYHELTAGTAIGAQILYRYQSIEWIDTLMCNPDRSIRLIRIKAQRQ